MSGVEYLNLLTEEIDLANDINVIARQTGAVQPSKQGVLSAIKSASERTGVDFSYLLTEAMQESGLNPKVKAGSSSASGLYQFIDQTWLKTVKVAGAKHGLGVWAGKITIGDDGMARVANAADRKAILALRFDPEASANMAAELAKTNKEQLERQVGGDIGATEMYLAHFLGAGGASNFLNEMKSNPNAKAADLLPSAAAANTNVFFDRATGRAKSVAEVYQKFAAKFDAPADVLTDKAIRMAAAAAPSSASMVPSLQTYQSQARKVETQLANEMLASRFSPSASDNVTLSNGVTVGAATTSSFAAMMLAQMDMESFAIDAQSNLDKMGKSDEMRRRSVLETLAKAA